MPDLVSGIYPITFTATNSTGLTNSGSAVLNVGITDPYIIFNTVVSSSTVSPLVLSSGADTTLSFGTVGSSSNVSVLNLIVSGPSPELTFTPVLSVGSIVHVLSITTDSSPPSPGVHMRTLIVSDFPATAVVTANDLQQPLIKLHQLCRRSSAEVARQIEAHIHTLYFLMPGTAIGTAPDSTPAATVKLKALYPAFTGFDRAWRIKAKRVRRLSENAAVQAAIASQLQFWLEKQGWTFA